MTKIRAKHSRTISRRLAKLRKKKNQKQTPQQTPEQAQQISDDQKQLLQWILEQTQLRYNELQDKSDKQLDLNTRLLGFCAISGFTTFLSKSTWDDLSGVGATTTLKLSIKLLFGVVITAIMVFGIHSMALSWDDKHFLDVTKLEQEQSLEERTTSLIKYLNTRIKSLRRGNYLYTIVLYLLYAFYATSLELLVLAILLYH